MMAVDTSVVVAGFGDWHEKHAAARRVIDAGAQLVDHCALESYSVLTRLPAPHRVSGALARDFLRANFRQPFLRLAAASQRRFILALPESGTVGGAVYDALVAATAAEHDLALASCDRRAASTYERYGVRFTLL